MASDISVKMAVEGEASFNSAIKAANSQIKALDAELKNVASSFDDTNSAEEKAAAQMEVLSQKADVQREKLEVLNQQHETAKARLDELGAALEEARQSHEENSAEVNKAARAYNEQAQYVANLERQMSTTSASINETTRAMDELGNEAGDAGNKMGLFGQIVSAEMVSSLAIDGLKKLGEALKELVQDTVDYGNNVDKMSQKMGMSAQGYQEWDFIMQHCDISISTLKTSMKTLATAAETGNEAFEKLGISQEELASLDQEGLFNRTIEALMEVEDVTQRTYIAGQLLGRGATELGPLLNMSADDIDAMRDRVSALGGVMSDDAVKASAAFKDAWQDMTTLLQADARNAVSVVIPYLTEIIEFAVETAEAVRTAGTIDTDTYGSSVDLLRAARDNYHAIQEEMTRMATSGDYDALAGKQNELNNAWLQWQQILSDVETRTNVIELVANGQLDAATAAELLGVSIGQLGGYVRQYNQEQQHSAEVTDGAAEAIDREAAAAEAAKASMMDIAFAAYDAYHSGGDLREQYNELSRQFEALDASVNPALAAIVETELATLNLAATNQELTSGYPELVSAVSGFGYSVTELSAWLIENGVTADEWGGQVMGTVNNIVNGFSELDTSLDMSLEQMAENLRKNIDAYSNWRDNIDEMMDAAVASGDAGAIAFVEHMESMGVGAAAQVQQMHDNMQQSFDTFAPMFGEAIDEGVLEMFNKIENSNVSGAVEGMNQEVIDTVQNMDIGDAGSQIPEQVASNITANSEQVSSAVTEVAEAGIAAFDDQDFTPSGEAAVSEIAAGITGATDQVTGAAEGLANEAAAAFDAVDFSPSGEAFDAEIAAGITGSGGDVSGAAEGVANDAAERAKIDTSDVGEYLMSGVEAGIRNGRSGVINAAVEAVQAAVSAAKAAAAIASPSKVMRDEVGKFLTEGIAVGMLDSGALQSLEASADDLVSALAGWFRVDMATAESEITSAVSDWAKAWQEQLSETIRIGEHAINMIGWQGGDKDRQIAEYKKLQDALHQQAEGYRKAGLAETSKYIQDLQTKWWGYEQKIRDIEEEKEKERLAAEEEANRAREEAAEAFSDTWEKALDKFADDYQAAFNDLMKAQENMQNKMAGYGDLFHLTGTTVSLESLDSQTKFIERYGKTLESLRDRGINGDLLNEILDMDVKNATFYGEKLLSMSNMEWEKYMDSYAAKQEAAARISEQWFQGDFEALNEEFIDKIPDAVADLGKELEDLGVEAADAITEAFESRQEEIANSFRDVLQAAMQEAGAALGIDLDLGKTLADYQAQAAAIAAEPERDRVTATELQTVMSGVVNGISSLMDAHMNQGESELTVNIGGEMLARILLPYLVATAQANGTPIVNG